MLSNIPSFTAGVEARRSAIPTYLNASGLRPAFARQAHTSDIQRFAGWNGRGEVRSRPASYGPDIWGSAAVRSEVGMVQTDDRLQAWECTPVGDQHAELSAILARRLADLVVKIAHIAKSLTRQIKPLRKSMRGHSAEKGPLQNQKGLPRFSGEERSQYRGPVLAI
jgi:hypothetical protein